MGESGPLPPPPKKHSRDSASAGDHFSFRPRLTPIERAIHERDSLSRLENQFLYTPVQ